MIGPSDSYVSSGLKTPTRYFLSHHLLNMSVACHGQVFFSVFPPVTGTGNCSMGGSENEHDEPKIDPSKGDLSSHSIVLYCSGSSHF